MAENIEKIIDKLKEMKDEFTTLKSANHKQGNDKFYTLSQLLDRIIDRIYPEKDAKQIKANSSSSFRVIADKTEAQEQEEYIYDIDLKLRTIGTVLSEYEIFGFYDFKPVKEKAETKIVPKLGEQKSTKIINTTKEMAESWTKRARNKMDEARTQLKEKYNYPESISASQECIELSIKAIFVLLTNSCPKSHEFKEEEFETVLKKFPERLNIDCQKLYLYSKFWSEFYTTAKYGLEKLGVGAEKLFEKEEAELALKHADKCHFAATQLDSYKKYPW